MQRACAWLVIVALGGACTQRLPPAEDPAHQVPAVGTLPPLAPGMGRVVIDVVDGPAIVEEEISRTERVTQSGGGSTQTTVRYNGPPIRKKICVTPCVVDLPLGAHDLRLTLRETPNRSEKVALMFSDAPLLYRRALSGGRPPVKWWVGTSLLATGSLAFLLSSALLLSNADANNTSIISPGGLVLGLGGSMGVVGLVVTQKNPRLIRQGAENQWPLEVPAAPVVGDPGPTRPEPQRPPVGGKSEQERAVALFDRGKSHYNVQEYEEALKDFKEAYLLSREPDLLINIGQCYRQMGRNTDAIKAYRAFLSEAPDSPLRPQVEEILRELEKK